MKIIAVIGSGRRSGKTTAIERLVEELTLRGRRVGTIKQIHEDDFTLETEGKDTWKHADAGARIVVFAAPREVAAIKRIKSENRLDEALSLMKGEDLDYVIIEGNPGRNVPVIFAAGRAENAEKVGAIVKEAGGQLICVSTLASEKFDREIFSVPALHPEKDAKEMADLVERI